MQPKSSKKIEIDLSLIKKSINQELTSEEAEILSNWLKSSKQHQIYYNNIHKSYINGDYVDLDDNIIISKIIGSKGKLKKINRRNIYYSAASIITILVSILLLTHKHHKELVTKLDKEFPILITEKGEKIYLKNEGDLHSNLFDSINLQKKDNELIYDSIVSKTNEKHTIIVPKGTDYYLSLSDGTKVWLNSCTTFSFPVNFSQEHRNVSLNGEAFFEVAKDSNRVFRVNTGVFNIKVYGTKFNVDCYSHNTMETSLVEGVIGVSSNNNKFKEKILNIGEKIEINSNNYSYTISNIDIETIGDWRMGYFSFNNQPLHKIMTKLKHWYNIEIQYEDDSLKYKRFSGRISRKKEINGILDIIERTMLVKFNIRNNIIIIRSVKK